ncbi:formin-binding protein 4-like [Daktulosphaira vitifoliae]|uniref:formin-binding protein 4-like n=1 Tax=Daktulosphaira vitifoliae TaxID=58002 RepID=UPI0021AA1BD8|nr:formin-binding protein 4-like [Daktulosphaira vitifoliae]
MNKRKLKLDMTQSSEKDSIGIELYRHNINDQLININQDNSDQIWQECYDEVSGFIYYWNMKTNKVTWEKPEHYTAHCGVNEGILSKNDELITRKRLSSDEISSLNIINSKKSKTESKTISALVAYGSDTSDDDDGDDKDDEVQKSSILERLQQEAEMFKQNEIKNNSINESKNKTESHNTTDILHVIEKEVPPDYLNDKADTLDPSKKNSPSDIFEILKSEVPPDYKEKVLSSENKSISIDSELTNIQTNNILNPISNLNDESILVSQNIENKNSQNPLNLIANYGEDNEIANNEFDEQKLIYTHDPCANSKIGFGYKLSSKNKNTGSINFVKGETMNSQSEVLSTVIQSPAKSTESSDVNDTNNEKNQVQELSMLISAKLHFLSDCESNTNLSSVQIMTIKIDTLMEAWKENSLKDEYFSKWLDEMAIELNTLEKSVAPAGWNCQWDKLNTRYFYQNISNGHTQWHYPIEESESIETSPKDTEVHTPSPLNISEHDSHPEPEDMDIEDDGHKEGTEIIVPPVPGDELSFELNSFYADIAQFESNSTGQIETMVAVQSPSIEQSPCLKIISDSDKKLEEKEIVVKPKKKKKVGKLDMGLGLKHKHVSSLVEKWQQIQNEIK